MTARDRELARVIDRHGRYGEQIVTEARRAGLQISMACALVEQESEFRNVFGHDPVRRGQIVGGNVTRARVLRYLAMRALGRGNQGVGVTQLTSPGYQDRARRLGGLHKVTYQLRVGFETVDGLVKRHGTHRGLASYNAGEAGWKNGVDYANQVARRAEKWHDIFTKEAP